MISNPISQNSLRSPLLPGSWNWRRWICLHLIVWTPMIAMSSGAPKGDAIDALMALNASALLVLDHEDTVIAGKLADSPMVPASTVKLITAWLAVTHWGENHHFKTSFYWDDRFNRLWVVGGGDPFLVSEELRLVARKLATLLPGKVSSIGIDGSLFERDLKPPGSGLSTNPYDAVPSAVAANFNTINLIRINGELASGEEQTPLTAMAQQFDQRVGTQRERINLGRRTVDAERYFAELLTVLLEQEGVQVESDTRFGSVPALLTSDPLWEHHQSRTLGEILQLMLKYSTNFIANQLMLTLVASELQRPASFADVEQYMNQRLAEQFAWEQSYLVDGAGLSPQNRLSSVQLVELLREFEPWRHLMPQLASNVFAKTGTLTSVRTLAGYLKIGDHWQRFAILVNESAPPDLVTQVASEFVAGQLP